MKQTIIEYDAIPLNNLPRLSKNNSIDDDSETSMAFILRRGMTFKKDPFVTQFKPKTG